MIREIPSPKKKDRWGIAELFLGEELEGVDEERSYKGQYHYHPEDGVALLVRLGST